MSDQRKGKKVRLTVDLQPRFYNRLAQLEELVEANSKADMIRDSLRIYDAIARKVLEGNRICAVDNDGNLQEFVFVAPMPDPAAQS